MGIIELKKERLSPAQDALLGKIAREDVAAGCAIGSPGESKVIGWRHDLGGPVIAMRDLGPIYVLTRAGRRVRTNLGGET